MVISESVSQNNECDAESQVKMSILSALRHSYAEKKSEMKNLQSSIENKEAEVAKLRIYLNTTQEEALTILTTIQNRTTPDVLALETACEGANVIDCCQVRRIFLSVLK